MFVMTDRQTEVLKEDRGRKKDEMTKRVKK